jgi:hypothetical protein
MSAGFRGEILENRADSRSPQKTGKSRAEVQPLELAHVRTSWQPISGRDSHVLDPSTPLLRKTSIFPTTPPSALLFRTTTEARWLVGSQAPRATAGLVQSPTFPRRERNQGPLAPRSRSGQISTQVHRCRCWVDRSPCSIVSTSRETYRICPRGVARGKLFIRFRSTLSGLGPRRLEAKLSLSGLQTTRAITSIRSFTSPRVHTPMSLTPPNAPAPSLSFTAAWKTACTRNGFSGDEFMSDRRMLSRCC